jgi:hypothetical protein
MMRGMKKSDVSLVLAISLFSGLGVGLYWHFAKAVHYVGGFPGDIESPVLGIIVFAGSVIFWPLAIFVFRNLRK